MSRRAVLESVVGVGFGQGMSTILRAADLPSHLEVGEASIDVSFDSDQFDIDRAALFDWVRQSARATTAYFGRFPVTHARVRLLQSPGARVSNGVSFGEPGARCRITVGQHVTQADLDDDWVLTPRHHLSMCSSIVEEKSNNIPGRFGRLAALWRQKQLEYTWLRSLMERYEDFWEVTRAALRSAIMQLKIEASGAQLDRLIGLLERRHFRK